jgi:glucose-6-phosphate-specific signal transduction histidine kinase
VIAGVQEVVIFDVVVEGLIVACEKCRWMVLVWRRLLVRLMVEVELVKHDIVLLVLVVVVVVVVVEVMAERVMRNPRAFEEDWRMVAAKEVDSCRVAHGNVVLVAA